MLSKRFKLILTVFIISILWLQAAYAGVTPLQIDIKNYDTLDIGNIFNNELAPGESDFAMLSLNNKIGKQVTVGKISCDIELFKAGEKLELNSEQAVKFLNLMNLKIEHGDIKNREVIYNGNFKDFQNSVVSDMVIPDGTSDILFYTVTFSSFAEKDLANISSNINFQITLTAPGGSSRSTTGGGTIKTCPFTDIRGHWAEQDILSLCKKGILSSYQPPLLKPQEKLTRAEAALLVAKALKLTGEEEKFATQEVLPSKEKNYILVLMKLGIFRGYPPALFMPNKFITREEMACVVARATMQGSSAAQLSNFISDKYKIGTWARKCVEKSLTQSLAKGYPDKTLRPNKVATRAEAMAMVNRMLNANGLK